MDSLTINIPCEAISALKDHIKLYNAFTADIQNDEILVSVVPYAGVESHEQAKALQTFVKHINPDMIDLFINIDEQLNKQLTHPQVNPVVEMKKKFWEIFDAANVGRGQFSAWDVDEHHGDEPVPGYFDAWDSFMNQIGGAPMLVAYAGVKLRRKFEAAGQDYSWIDKCVDYYEANWEF